MDQFEAPTRRTSKRPAAPTATHGLRDTTQTCAHCRKNKLRCSGERPQCSACASRNAPCEYDEATRAPLTRAAPTLTTGTSRKRPAPTSTYAQIKESRQRKRAAAAQTSCDFCRNDLRRKCDGLRPSCQSCIKRGEPCVYSGPASVPVATSPITPLPRMSRSEDEESDIAMPSRSHSPDIPLAESGASPTTPLDPNRPRYPQGNGLGHAGSTRNPDGTNCTRPVACFFCIKVELPCTGDFPTCVNCVRRNLQCAYPDPSSYAHQFPRQSAMHTRQLKDGTPHRSSTSGPHTSPGRGQLTSSQPSLHPSRSQPGPLNQNHTQLGPTPPPMSASPDSMTHSRQRSMSGPNGLPGFGTEAIRSASAANVDTIPRSTSGPRPTSTASPARLPNSNAAHSRTPSTVGAPTSASPGQPTLSNPIPLPALRSTTQPPSTPIQNHSQPPTQTPTQTHTQNHGQLPNQIQNPAPAERVLDTVRGPPGDVRSPVNGVLVSPSGRTRDASLVHGPGTHSRSGSTGQGDGFVHEGPASYRARVGEGDGTSPNDTPLRNGVLTTPTAQSHPRVGVPTGTPARATRVPMRPPDSGHEPAADANDVQRPDSSQAPAEPRADPSSGSGATRAPNAMVGTLSRHIDSRPGPPAAGDSQIGASGPVQAPASGGSGAALPTTPASATTVGPASPTRTGTGPDPRPASGNIDPRSLPEDVRDRPNGSDEPRSRPEDQRPPKTEEPRPRPNNPLPDSLPRRPSVPSPITQHPARDLSIIAPMGRPDTGRRDSGGGRYDPRRDIGIRDDRRDSTLSDRRGSTSGANNWQPRPNTQPRPLPPLDTRAPNLNVRKDHSPHTPRNQPLPLEPRGGQARERSPTRKSGSPVVSGAAGVTTPQNNRSRAGSRRRSQSPRGMYLRAESGSIRSSPMDMDSS